MDGDAPLTKLLVRVRDEGIDEARAHGLSSVAEPTDVPDWCLTQAVLFRAANMAVWGFEDGRVLSLEEVVEEAVKGVSRKPEALKLLCREVDALVKRVAGRVGGEGRAPVFVDVGCGSGLALALIANHPLIKGGAEPRLIGVDHDPRMIEALKVMLPQAAPLQASAESLPLRPNVADAVLSVGMLHEVSSVKAFTNSVARTLRGGGEVLIADSFAPPLTAALMRVGRVIRAAIRGGPENPWGLEEVVGTLKSSGLTPRYVKALPRKALRTYPALVVAVKGSG